MELNGVVYEGSGCAINATTGTPVWNLPTSNHISVTADATGGRRIFTGSVGVHRVGGRRSGP
jgi:outer membrane protein assembly factor BamB